ncbi:hypothetical protein GOP47_0030523 [Adiantum capillus-veneris]|nr:hypothetical protein GOP47_0030523 [Adiantum capillus-veneris]
MAHLHSVYASFKARKLSGGKRKLFCLSGLKEGISTIDGDKRVLHSTHRATHYLIPSSAGVSPLDEQPCGAHSPPNAEKPVHSEQRIDEPEASVSISDRPQDGSPCGGQNNTQPSIGYRDTDEEEGEFDGITILRSLPEGTSPSTGETLPHCHANARSEYPSSQEVGIIVSLGMQISCLEIQRTCGVCEFCTGQFVTPSTPDLYSEVKSWDSKGLCNGDAKFKCCTMQIVCNNDDDRCSVFLQENGVMPAFVEKGHFGLIEKICHDDDTDMGKGVMEENNIVSACIGSCLTTIFDNKNVSDTVENVCNSYGNDGASLVLDENDIMTVCTCDNLTENFSAFSSQKIEAVYAVDNKNSLDLAKISSLNTFDTPTRKNLFVRSFLMAQCRLTLQKLFGSLVKKNLDWKVGVLGEQVIVYTINYLRSSQSRYLLARRRKTIAASGYFRQSLHKHIEKAPFKGVGHYNMYVQVIVQDNIKCQLMGRITYVSRMSFSVEYNSSVIEQACQYASTISSKVGDSRVSRLLEVRDEKVSCLMESSSDAFYGFSRSFQGSLKNGEQVYYESDESSHNVFTDMSINRALELQNLLEVTDGGMTSSLESPCEEMDEFTKDFKNPHCFPCGRRTNKVDDWTSLSAEQVDECLDTCLYNLHDHPNRFLHNFTPRLKLLDSVVMGNNPLSTSAYSPNFDDGSQTTDVFANASKNGVSCLPVSEPHSHTFSLWSPILSYDEEVCLLFPIVYGQLVLKLMCY